MEQCILKPIKGFVVRDPGTKQILPEEGKSVIMNSYWRRRLKDGSVILTEEEQTSVVKKIESIFKKGNES